MRLCRLIIAAIIAGLLRPLTKLIFRFDRQLTSNPHSKRMAEAYLNWLCSLAPEDYPAIAEIRHLTCQDQTSPPIALAQRRYTCPEFHPIARGDVGFDYFYCEECDLRYDATTDLQIL